MKKKKEMSALEKIEEKFRCGKKISEVDIKFLIEYIHAQDHQMSRMKFDEREFGWG